MAPQRELSKTTKERVFPIDDLSGGTQVASTEFQKRAGDLDLAQNADFGTVGAVGKALGYAQNGDDLTSTTSTSTSTSTTTTSTSTSTTTSTSTSTTTTA